MLVARYSAKASLIAILMVNAFVVAVFCVLPILLAISDHSGSQAEDWIMVGFGLVLTGIIISTGVLKMITSMEIRREKEGLILDWQTLIRRGSFTLVGNYTVTRGNRWNQTISFDLPGGGKQKLRVLRERKMDNFLMALSGPGVGR
jgi:hypothetical protein